MSRNYISQTEKAKREAGDKNYPIWLVVNPKYPAVRHQIWTPVLSEIQDKVYRRIQNRIDTTNLYIRNAVIDSGIVPNTMNWWGIEVGEEIKLFREIVLEYKPKIIISFGAFPYEFLRRVFKVKPEKGPVYWGNAILGDMFGKAIQNFDINKTNRLPLLHRINSGEKFFENQNFESENYFQYVGTKIAEKILEHKNDLKIWID
ncbi:hypothetical protein [Desulfosporosinus sp. SB140]|uniref:hypothetical protein n=1 Tax=Desulfosporosinus paludis TaxID=3115649 RepID=UPI003890A38C